MDAPSRHKPLLPFALFLCGAIGIALLGLRLVRAERQGAERSARERLRAEAGEKARQISDAAALLEKLARSGGAGSATMVKGVFTIPREPVDAIPLVTIPGRDSEGDFLLAEAEKNEREGRMDRARGELAAAAGPSRDPTIRTVARIRRAAMLRRVEDPQAEDAAREALAELAQSNPEARSRSREGLLLRSLHESIPEARDSLTADVAALVGGPDDVFARALLRELRANAADRDAELALIARLRAAALEPPMGESRATFDGYEMIVAVSVDADTRRFARTTLGSWLDSSDGTGLVTANAPLRTDVLAERVPIGALLPDLSVEARAGFESVLEEARERTWTVLFLLVLVALAGVSSFVMFARAARHERDAAAAKSEFVTRVGHDLRTPLTLIRMYAETIAEGRVGTSGETREFAGIVARESERLTRLVSTVLDFARISAPMAAGSTARRVVDLVELVDEIVIAHRPLVERGGMRISFLAPHTTNGACAVAVDADALRGAIGNLIENALVHAADGGAIDLQVEGARDLVEISVSDRGPGLPERSFERVFERFARGDDAKGKGTGLGLALVREVARAHGGDADARAREGGGLVVTIRLPRFTDSDASAPSAPSNSNRNGSLS